MKKFMTWLFDIEAPGLLLKIMVLSISLGVAAAHLFTK